jgi:hypothetical protein
MSSRLPIRLSLASLMLAPLLIGAGAALMAAPSDPSAPDDTALTLPPVSTPRSLRTIWAMCAI